MISNSDCKTSCYSIHLKESLAVVDFTGDIYQLGACLEEKATFPARLQALNYEDKAMARVMARQNFDKG